jgi:anti-anti-sigma regulatory factor
MWHFQPPPGPDNLSCETTGGGTPDVVFRLNGMLSFDWSSIRFERAVEAQWRDRVVRRIHLDLRKLGAIDLDGIAVLVRLFRGTGRRGKSLTVEGSSGVVRRRLVTAGVLRRMESPAEPAC